MVDLEGVPIDQPADGGALLEWASLGFSAVPSCRTVLLWLLEQERFCQLDAKGGQESACRWNEVE